MEINIDEILRDAGVTTPTAPQPSAISVVPVPHEEEQTEEDLINSLEEDLNNILAENGISETDIEDTDAMERQSENPDYNGETDALSSTEDTEEESIEEEENVEEENTSTSNTSIEEAKIPLNSPTLLIDNSTSRFSGAEWYSEIQKQRIIVAGIGGIGSNLVFQLARMHPANITMYDNDTVETVNMAGQLFSYADVGKDKVDAISAMIVDYTSMQQVNAIKRIFTEDTEPGDIMMCGFDNMRARKTFFNSWCRHLDELPDEKKCKCLFIDGRLSIDTLQVFCIKGDDSYNKHRYKKEFLFRDSEADATVCSMKQTTYLACMIGSLMVNLFTNFVAGLLNPVIPYDLPFFTEYDAQNMIFKTEN
jgi:molybdopterin/thiamine biosynthesis adenylyltransferase